MDSALVAKNLGRTAGRQRGLALIVSLIILVVMSLAGIALVRSIDTGILVAGNLAFRQAGAHAGQRGVEEARQWLLDHKASLAEDHTGDGYYANSQGALDLTGNRTPSDAADNVKWEGDAGLADDRCLAAKVGDNTVCYIIHRLCSASGIDLASAQCATKEGALGGSSQGAVRQMGSYQQGSWTAATAYGYYRITVRTRGPRDTISFLQAFVTI